MKKVVVVFIAMLCSSLSADRPFPTDEEIAIILQHGECEGYKEGTTKRFVRAFSARHGLSKKQEEELLAWIRSNEFQLEQNRVGFAKRRSLDFPRQH